MTAPSTSRHAARLVPRGAVRVESVHVDRTPGIPEPFAIDALSPGLNLVVGPNASGKSSLLRALDALVWPAHAGSAERNVRGRLADATQRWDVRLDGIAATVHTDDGTPVEPPIWPAPALRHRLHFALHDLLAVSRDPDAFAAAIMRASAGGLDILRAGTEVGAVERAPRTLAQRRSYDDAVRDVSDAQQQQRALHDEECALDQRRLERDAARDASTQRECVSQALEWHAIMARVSNADAGLAQLPPALSLLRGHELEQAHAMLAFWRDAHARFAMAQARQARAQAAQAEAFPGDPPTLEQREAWRHGLESLRRAEAVLERTRAQMVEKHALHVQAAAALSSVNPDALTPVSPQAVAEAAALATRLESALALEAAARAHAAVLDDAHTVSPARAPISTSPAEDATIARDALRDAVRILTEWLAADAVRRASDAAPYELVHWTLTAAAVIGWIAAALAWHVSAALLGLIVAAFALWRRPRAATRERDEAAARCQRLEREFVRLAVPAPRSWDTVGVRAQLDVLAQAVGDVTTDARHREERERTAARLSRAQDALRVLQDDASAVAARIGFAPDTDGRTLAWLLERLARVQDAHAEFVRAEAAWRDAQEAHGHAVRRITGTTTAPRSLADAEAAVAALEQRWEAHAAASSEVVQATDEARRAELECRRIAEEWRALVVPLGIDAPLLAPETIEGPVQAALLTLRQLLGQREILSTYQTARADATRDLARLQEMVRDRERFEALVALPVALLTEQAERLQARADTYEDCLHAVSSLETRLEVAASSHAVADALAHRAACLDAVRAAWHDALAARIAHTLVAHVQRDTRDVQRPAVFHHARALFGRITRGRWRLHLDERDGVAHFRAEDTTTGVHHGLETLSAGTRVQLLVAVRVAFVESEETDGVRLPLFFDETLGTSDDQRAEALMHAVLTLVAEGRQLFYVTAQRDEVQSWHAVLAEHEANGTPVPWRDIDLGLVRRTMALPHPPRMPAPAPVRTLPDSALASHRAFGAAIAVAAVDPARTAAAGWPLWYLTDDVRLLHAAWRLGIEHWGELAGFREAGGTLSVEGCSAPEVALRLDALSHVASLADALHTLCAVGQERPITRSALRELGVVTPVFFDAVADVAERVEGSATRLLAALTDGAVARFGPSRVEPLRESLRAGGWLNESVSLSADEIRWGVIARSARVDAADLVDALLERLRRGAALDPERSHATPSP